MNNEVSSRGNPENKRSICFKLYKAHPLSQQNVWISHFWLWHAWTHRYPCWPRLSGFVYGWLASLFLTKVTLAAIGWWETGQRVVEVALTPGWVSVRAARLRGWDHPLAPVTLVCTSSRVGWVCLGEDLICVNIYQLYSICIYTHHVYCVYTLYTHYVYLQSSYVSKYGNHLKGGMGSKPKSKLLWMYLW